MHQDALAHTKHHPHKNAQHPAHSVGQGAAPSSGSRRALQTVPRTRHARCAARRRRRAASADQDTRMAQPLGDRRRLCQTETTSQPSGRAAPKRGQYRQVISTSTSTNPHDTSTIRPPPRRGRSRRGWPRRRGDGARHRRRRRRGSARGRHGGRRRAGHGTRTGARSRTLWGRRPSPSWGRCTGGCAGPTRGPPGGRGTGPSMPCSSGGTEETGRYPRGGGQPQRTMRGSSGQ